MFRSLLVTLGALGLSLTSPGTASAHQRELGVSIEPAMYAFPAIADGNTNSTLAFGAGGGLSLEYYFLNDFALMVRGGYTQALGDSSIGQATIQSRPGNYYFQQSTGYALAGIRAETPSYLMPVSFYFAALGGVALLSQTNRTLKDTNGLDFGLGLQNIIKPVPAVSLSVGISGRITNQIRLQAEPALLLLPINPVAIGFGLTLSITFLFFT